MSVALLGDMLFSTYVQGKVRIARLAFAEFKRFDNQIGVTVIQVDKLSLRILESLAVLFFDWFRRLARLDAKFFVHGIEVHV